MPGKEIAALVFKRLCTTEQKLQIKFSNIKIYLNMVSTVDSVEQEPPTSTGFGQKMTFL